MSIELKYTQITRVVASSFEDVATFIRSLQHKVEIKNIIFDGDEWSILFIPPDTVQMPSEIRI